jgi:tetratricopeptide (TPR) repeat protein
MHEHKYVQAELLLNNVVQVRRKVLGEENPETLSSEADLAALYRHRGQYPKAELLYTKVLMSLRSVLGAKHRSTTNVMDRLAEVHIQRRKFEEAEPLLREALGTQTKVSPDSWNRYYTQALLGACLAGRTKYQEAESLLISGYVGLTQRQSSIPVEDRSFIAQTGERILQLYKVWNKPEKAAEWRATLRRE